MIPLLVRRAALLIAGTICLASSLPGCGSGGGAGEISPASTAEVGPHGGRAYPLPGGAGFVEVLHETVGTPVPKKALPVVMAVYFLGPDRKASLSPAPSNVSVTATLPGNEASQAIQLTPTPKAGDPAGAVRYASNQGAFDADEISGEVKATVGGGAVTVPFSFR